MLFADPLTDTLARALALLFGLGGVGIVAAVRGNIARLARSVLWLRYRTWLLLALLFGLAVLGGPAATALLAAGGAVMATREYARMMELDRVYAGALLAACLGGIGLALLGPGAAGASAGLALAAGLVPALVRQQPVELPMAARTTLGALYLGWALTLLVLLAALPGGGAWLALALLGTAVSDVAAFSLGSLAGGPKLCPHLSPTKTWAGAGGNLLGAALALLLLAPALPPLAPPAALLVVLAIGLGSLAGDLVESLLKRACGVKDAGAWLAGFGGLLDRIDSLLLVAPLLYAIARLLG